MSGIDQRLFVRLVDGTERELVVYEEMGGEAMGEAYRKLPIALFNSEFANTFETTIGTWIAPEHVIETWWVDL